MPYKLKDANILSELHPGDVITADLLVSQDADEPSGAGSLVVVAQGKPDYRPKVTYHVPAPGDRCRISSCATRMAPIHLDQFRGKALLITFIYTRCPLPNFCPRVTRNFADINQAAFDRSRRCTRKTHLLCVSFDPEHDTPSRFARLWGDLHWQRCQGCLCALGFCGARKAGARKTWRSTSMWA